GRPPPSSGWRNLVPLSEGDAVSLPEPIERAPVNAEKLGGQLLVPPGLSQETADVMGDDVAQAQARRRGRAVSSGGAADLRGKILGMQHGIRGQRHRPLDRVLELTHVAGPVVTHQQCEGVGPDGGDRSTARYPKAPQVIFRQGWEDRTTRKKPGDGEPTDAHAGTAA